ncbi:hypothetical protein EYS42_16510 [Aquabacterium lacunae]|uniref:DUF6748 domain-containing protein n=1 Tax=Aquabacterium lacunae TaxID=2528630 RepID=A0A4Q9GWX4_9BURK|nr:DUF6748 domain-containing protein [Aquabacterium lacunae]TBO27707.1 hypothetical protein EYS42_16510 [Aquabacterium lacunae]
MSALNLLAARRTPWLAVASALTTLVMGGLSPAAWAQTQAPAEPTGSALTTYQVVGQDFRKCAFPFCGGYYVKAVNQALTRCADGKWATRCHAVTLDTAALGWSVDQQASFNEPWGQGQALVQGQLALTEVQGVKANVLTVSSAWQGQVGKQAKGSVYSVRDTGIRCIVAPCPSLEARLLNSRKAPFNTELNLSASGATDEQVAASGPALGATGVLVAGTVAPTTTSTFDGRTVKVNQLVATEFYLPAKP